MTTTIETPNPKSKKRRTPTEKQIENLLTLDTEALIAKSLEALHALNRRAKTKRDQANALNDYSHRWAARRHIQQAIRDEMEAIYGLKNRLLLSLLRGGRAKLYSYEMNRQTGWYCHSCDREWWGWDGDCYGCGMEGAPITAAECWFIVEAGGFRFHQPEDTIPKDVEALAQPTEPHDPNQEAREIPNVGLTIAAQHRCIELAIERLVPDSERDGIVMPAARANGEGDPPAQVRDHGDGSFIAEAPGM